MIKNSESAGNRKKVEDYSYCLSHNIGKGYSSQVFKGRNDNSNEIVAIKVIDMRMLKGEVHKNLLESEIEVLRCLKNARNIVQVFDIYTTKNNTYIMTEFCQGGDLSKLISSRRGMPETEAIPYLKQIVDGYSQISSNQIIHRDLKPANILLKENKIKIADFGFAMKSSESKKQSSYNVGSPIYMPPEALNENKYSFKSDVWAIGVIYFQLLTGKTPWRAKTEKQLGRQLLSVPISKMMPVGLSETSVQFLLKTLCVDYEKRMSPQELERYMSRFDLQSSADSNIEHTKTCQSFKTSSTGITETQCSIRGTQEDQQTPKIHETSLNKNKINEPRNMGRFALLKGQGTPNGTLKEIKNTSLPKTVSTISHNQTEKALEAEQTRKKISKQLLSQVHFCRFVFKLFQRIESRIEGSINSELKSSMCGLVFQRLEDIVELKCLSPGLADYKKSNDYRKLCQIVSQYQEKYRKELGSIERLWKGFEVFETELSTEIKKIFEDVKASVLEESQQKVIILDYLITLRQLSNLLSKNSIEVFHQKSKIEAIVEGSPAKSITNEHLVAITSKLRTIKLI